MPVAAPFPICIIPRVSTTIVGAAVKVTAVAKFAAVSLVLSVACVIHGPRRPSFGGGRCWRGLLLGSFG